MGRKNRPSTNRMQKPKGGQVDRGFAPRNMPTPADQISDLRNRVVRIEQELARLRAVLENEEDYNE